MYGGLMLASLLLIPMAAAPQRRGVRADMSVVSLAFARL
jgi:hypothetical protein